MTKTAAQLDLDKLTRYSASRKHLGAMAPDEDGSYFKAEDVSAQARAQPAAAPIAPSVNSGEGAPSIDTPEFRTLAEKWQLCLTTDLEAAYGAMVAHINAQLAQQRQAAPHAPDGFILMPARLTADNGAKGALSGEFKEVVQVTCHECDGSGEDSEFESGCIECDGTGALTQDVLITWDTIKDIYKRAVDLLAGPAAPHAQAEPVAEVIETIVDGTCIMARTVKFIGSAARPGDKLYLAAPAPQEAEQASASLALSSDAKDRIRKRVMTKLLEGPEGPDVIGPVTQGCTIPPAGWFCTRTPGHEGPCAAWPDASPTTTKG